MFKHECLLKMVSATPYDMTKQGGQAGVSYSGTFLFADGSDQKLKFRDKETYELYKNLSMVEGVLEFSLVSKQAKPSVAFIDKFTTK